MGRLKVTQKRSPIGGTQTQRDTLRSLGLKRMHDVVVTGCGLDALLADVAAQVVTVLQQPPRSEQFAPTPGPRVVAVEVRRMEGSGGS